MSDNYRVTPVTANGNIDLSIINQNPDVVGNKIVETVDLSIPTYTIPETGSLNKENIDFSRISGTSSGVADNNFIGENRIAKDAWGDNGGLNYQIRKDGTVAIKEGDEIIGFTDQKGLQNSLYSKQAPDKVNIASINQNRDVASYGKEIPNNNTVGGQNLADINHRTDIKANTQAPNLASVNQNPDVRGYGKEVPNNNNTVGGQNLADINHNPSVSNKIPTETYAASNQPSTPQAIPEDFDFKHEQSNILAAKARNMGFTDDQIKMAIGVSRWETGNYEHLAYGYNYGGVTGKGDLGNEGGYAKFSTQDKGMDAFLQNLKKNYFDQGMNEIDGKFARKYVGDYSSDHLSSWVKGVKGCMS